MANSIQTRHHASSLSLTRLLYSILIGGSIGLFFLFVEAGLLLLLNPGHILASATNRVAALLSLLTHTPLFVVPIVLELVLAIIIVLRAARPFTLFLYLRDVRKAQEAYHKLYTPLTALTNIRRTLDTATPDTTSPTVAVREEQVSILNLVKNSDAHQMILGVPGAGKTTALRVYQYIASEHPWRLLMHGGRIPVYVPMKNYSLFLKTSQRAGSGNTIPLEAMSEVTLLDYLSESDLPGMRHLCPYLPSLAKQGRLLLLCDGLNEVDNHYLQQVDDELVHFMLDTPNRVVMTCREVDYREQQSFVRMVENGRAVQAVVYPLQPEQVTEFVERYVERQDKHWQHTAGQIIQVIDRSRLRYHCTNPMMLFTLMGIIDKIGVERGKQIDTRGRLLRESVRQLILQEQRQLKWNKGAPHEQDVVRFLAEVACAARWANDRNAIQLPISSVGETGDDAGTPLNFNELADELQFWLDEHPALGPFVSGEDGEPLFEPFHNLPQLLQFTMSTALIEISPGGVLSFRHELIAEYFVAECFYAIDQKQRNAATQIREELLDNVGRWSEPVAIWAGLLDDPLALAELFGVLGSQNRAYVLQALALSLVCVGVLWTPPQAEVQRTVVLPTHVSEALSIAVRNKAAREELSHIFTRCAEEGGQEVYRSLLPLIMIDGVDDLLTLLDKNIVPDLLFTQLQDTVDDAAYETQVRRITQVLGRFGYVVINRAVQLSLPAPERSLRLRAAAINILGGTNEHAAVDPLVLRLSDAEQAIVNRAATALARLGPQLTLGELVRELENRTSSPSSEGVHYAVLMIIDRFLNEQDPRHALSPMQCQLVIEKIAQVLTSNYQQEPNVQQLARTILVRQAHTEGSRGEASDCAQRVIQALVPFLSSQNENAVRNGVLAFQEIGPVATPYLLDQLRAASEMVRLRVIEVLHSTRDLRALPNLLQLVDDPSPAVLQQVAETLKLYQPESVPGLVDLVLHSPNDQTAARAAQILGDIGTASVPAIAQALPQVVIGRTRLLVQVLERLHEPTSIPALIALLQVSQGEPLLLIAVIRALSQFTDRQVVPPLLSVLGDSHPQVYEEAVNSLSMLGPLALGDLITSLDVEQDDSYVQRVRRAILGMSPFPGEQLIRALATCSDQQAEQIVFLLKTQGTEAAQALVKNLLHPDTRVRYYVEYTLTEMPGAIVVPALLDTLYHPTPLRKVASGALLNYPDAAISPLVDLLGEHERGEVASTILPQFGSRILRPLLSGLDDQRSLGRERSQNVIATLVNQTDDKQAILYDILQLFNPAPPQRAYDFLMNVLTGDLASVSIPALLEGLEDAHLINDAAEALLRLSRKDGYLTPVRESLLEALHTEERRGGAEVALVKIGAPVVPHVGKLLIDPNQLVVRSAKRILRDIGVPALPFIWNAYSSADNPQLRAAALDVFHSMPTAVVKDELVRLLTSDERSNISMAVALLLERIHDESVQQYADRRMVTELLEYIKINGDEKTNLRIISLLLLLGEQATLDPLIEELEDEPGRYKQLTYMLLLMGTAAQKTVMAAFRDPDVQPELRAELGTVLGMRSAPDVITEYARNVSSYGLASNRTSVLFAEQLTIALHALGALLASGQWDVNKLSEMRNANMPGTPAHELFSVLLGWRYAPEVTKLEHELDAERDAHMKESLALQAQVMMSEKHAQSLQDELDELKREHGTRGDELQKTTQEKDSLQKKLDQLTRDLERANQDNRSLQDRNQQMQKQLDQLDPAKKP